MKTSIKKLVATLLVASMVGCGALDMHKERKDGNVVQIYSMHGLPRVP